MPRRTAALQSRQLAILASLAMATGCGVPVATGLDEAEANRVIVALDRAGLDATKEVEPQAEGKFRVSVPRDDATRAFVALSEEALPHPKPKGVLESLDPKALVPSAAAEQAQIARGVSGELERTLSAVDGVLVARVHVSLPEKEPLRPAGPGARATASVLLEHRGASPPMTHEAVQRLVAGAASGLAPADVAVVMIPRARVTAAPREAAVAHVGPIAVLPASARSLQAVLAVLVAMVAVLCGLSLFLYTRLRVRRHAAEESARRA